MHRILSIPVISFFILLHVFDLTFAPALPFSSARIVFLYLFVLYGAFAWEGNRAIPLAVIAGLLRDFTSSEYLGLETLSLAAGAILLDWAVHKVDRRSSFIRGFYTFLFFLGVQGIQIFFVSLLSAQGKINGATLSMIFKTSLWNALVTPAFFYFSAFWFHDRKPLRQYELFR